MQYKCPDCNKCYKIEISDNGFIYTEVTLSELDKHQEIYVRHCKKCEAIRFFKGN